jgi:hypothetical protein
VNFAQIITTAISSILGVFIAAHVIAWQHARADRNAAAGRPVTVPASIRSAGPGRFALWRHGSMYIHRDRVVWTPRTPWGRSLVLGAVAFGTRRPPEGPLRWQLPPAAVVMPCSDAQRGYELAVLPASVKFLYWAQAA